MSIRGRRFLRCSALALAFLSAGSAPHVAPARPVIAPSPTESLSRYLYPEVRLRKLHLVLQFGETNHITATAAAIAVEQAFVGIYQEAGLAIGVQWTQSHPLATAECPGRLPIMRL